MFGIGRFKLGSAMTMALTVCLLLARIFLFRAYYAHALPGAAAPQAGFAPLPQHDAPPPASAWLLYATTDTATQIRTQHARLASDAAPGNAASFLDLTAVEGGAPQAVLTFATPQAACTGIDHLAASFDGQAPQTYPASAQWTETACGIRIEAFDRFVQALLNAQTLSLTPQPPGNGLHKVDFHVSGLTWESP